MNLRTLSNRLLMIAVGVCAVAVPSYADWGPGSPWVRQGKSATCHHSHVSSSGTATLVRRARVSVHRYSVTPFCEPELPPHLCPTSYQYEAAKVKNELSTADMIVWGLDDFIPVSFAPFAGSFKGVPKNGERWLPQPTNRLFTSLRAACQVSDKM